MKKKYIKPEIEMIEFRYSDIVAASGSTTAIEAGVGYNDNEIGPEPTTTQVSASSTYLGNWVNETTALPVETSVAGSSEEVEVGSY